MILCGGHGEQRYFESIRRRERLTATIVTCLSATSPHQMREECSKQGDRRQLDPELDRVWLVCDCDDFPCFDEVVTNPGETTSGLAIQVAWSNPRFELWLLLHFRDWSAVCAGSRIDAELCKQAGFETYKHGEDPYELVRAHTAAAVQRAGQLATRRQDEQSPPHGCPSTAVHLLVGGLLGITSSAAAGT
ncbi:MAG: RloB domain-containing protein [Fimbriimonadaceae bacterium]|nr:RloB domain-containing protein [Fimbriimonadaceae bacterium]